MLGLPLEGTGGSQSISTLVVAQNIASILYLKITTGLPITVCTSPLFECTGGPARTSHFISIHILPSSMPSPTGDASQQSAGKQSSISGLLSFCLLDPGFLNFLHLWLLCTWETLKKKKNPVVLFCVYECLVCMHECVLCVPGTLRSQKKVSDLL